MAPSYNAPVNLTIQVQEELIAASSNGNLGALATAPIAFAPNVNVIGATGPFHFTIPSNVLVGTTSLYVDNGGQPNDGWYFDYVSSNALAGVPLSPLTNPSGIILTTGSHGQGNIPGVYDNGVDGVGATYTVDPGSLPLSYDSNIPVADGDVVFFFGQDDMTQNGLYTYTLLTGVLTRQTGFDVPGAFVDGQYCYVINGFAGIPGTVYIINTSPWVPGVSPATYIQGNQPGAVSGVEQNTYDLNDAALTPTSQLGVTDYFMLLASQQANIQPAMNGATVNYYCYITTIAGSAYT